MLFLAKKSKKSSLMLVNKGAAFLLTEIKEIM